MRTGADSGSSNSSKLAPSLLLEAGTGCGTDLGAGLEAGAGRGATFGPVPDEEPCPDFVGAC